MARFCFLDRTYNGYSETKEGLFYKLFLLFLDVKGNYFEGWLILGFANNSEIFLLLFFLEGEGNYFWNFTVLNMATNFRKN